MFSFCSHGVNRSETQLSAAVVVETTEDRFIVRDANGLERFTAR
jgi:hypothetical protein